jgi:hypothetical protein
MERKWKYFFFFNLKNRLPLLHIQTFTILSSRHLRWACVEILTYTVRNGYGNLDLSRLVTRTTFSPSCVEAFNKAPIWLFWNSAFFVYQNIDPKPKYYQWKFWIFWQCNQIFGNFLHMKNGLGLLNPNLLEFLRYLYPFLSYKQIHFRYLYSAHNSARFFFAKKCFFDIKNLKIWTRQASFFCFFPWELRILPFLLW